MTSTSSTRLVSSGFSENKSLAGVLIVSRAHKTWSRSLLLKDFQPKVTELSLVLPYRMNRTKILNGSVWAKCPPVKFYFRCHVNVILPSWRFNTTREFGVVHLYLWVSIKKRLLYSVRLERYGRLPMNNDVETLRWIDVKLLIEFLGLRQTATMYGLGAFDLKIYQMSKVGTWRKSENFASSQWHWP